MMGVSRHVFMLTVAVICIIGGAIWQLQSIPDQQRIIIGSSGDRRYVQGFHDRELTLTERTPFRWAPPQGASIWFWSQPAGHQVHIHLHMYRPEPAPLTLASGDNTVTFTLSPGVRIYRLIFASAHQPITFTTLPITVPEDEQRTLGVAIFSIKITRTTSLTVSDLWQTFILPPFLPLAILGFWIASVIAGRVELIAIAPLTLAAVVLAGLLWTEWRLDIAWIVLHLSVIVLISAISYRLMQRSTAFRITDDALAIALLLCLGIITLILTYVPAIVSDGIGYYAYARALVYRGDLVMDETFDNTIISLPRTETGLLANPWSVGPAIVWTVPLMLYKLIAGGNGHEEGAYAVVCLISAWAGISTMIIAYRCVRRWYSPVASTIGAIGAFYGSTLWYYSMRSGGFAHALSAFACGLAILMWLRLREQPNLIRWILFGAAAGFVALIYWASVLLLVIPVLWLVGRLMTERYHWRQIIAITGAGVLAAVVALIVFSPQMIVWTAIYGAPIVKPPGTPSLVLNNPHIIELFTARFGLARWTPLAMVGLLGLLVFARRAPAIGSILIGATILYIGYNGLLSDWHGSGAFGTRRLTSLAIWYAFGLAAVAEVLINRRRVLTVLIGLVSGSWWVLMLMIRHTVGDLPETGWAYLETLNLVDLYLGPATLPLLQLDDFLKTGFVWDTITRAPFMFAVKVLGYLTVLSGIVVWVSWRLAVGRPQVDTNK